MRDIQKDIHLVSGMLKTESKKLHSGGWGTEAVLRWEDNDTILINDVRYDIE